jgi:hypothetical protein
MLYFYYIKATFINLLHLMMIYILQFVYYPILINVIQTEVKNINNNNKQKKNYQILTFSLVIIIRKSTKKKRKNINYHFFFKKIH